MDALLAKNEEERMHIHVICGGHEAKYWLEPRVELAKKGGPAMLITSWRAPGNPRTQVK